MKTPEEIKRGLKLCSHEGHGEEIICEHCPYDSSSCAVLICTRRLSSDALAYIQQLETENHQLLKDRSPRWISVEERLPEITEHRGKYDVSVRVLCACLQKSGRRMVKEGYFEIFDGKYFKWRIPGTIEKVTHWMPMPSAPKEDDK